MVIVRRRISARTQTVNYTCYLKHIHVLYLSLDMIFEFMSAHLLTFLIVFVYSLDLATPIQKFL